MYYGDLGKRIIASIIDGIILCMCSFVLILMFGLFGCVIAWIGGWLYYILMCGGNWHATLGKRIMGLYLADEYGNGISYSTAFVRRLCEYLSSLILCIGYLIAFFTDKKQALHDILAGTYVMTGKAEEHCNNFNNYNNYNNNFDNGGYGRMPEIVGVSGPLSGMVYQVDQKGVLIGRDDVSCQVVLPDSQNKVSRVHCYVTFNQMSGMFVLSDRNSTHGTYLLNGTRVSIQHPAALKSGDRFYVATRDNTFEVR